MRLRNLIILCAFLGLAAGKIAAAGELDLMAMRGDAMGEKPPVNAIRMNESHQIGAGVGEAFPTAREGNAATLQTQPTSAGPETHFTYLEWKNVCPTSPMTGGWTGDAPECAGGFEFVTPFATKAPKVSENMLADFLESLLEEQ